jgi:hypothetical protein
MTVRMVCDFLRTETSIPNLLLDERMVCRHLGNCPVSDDIGPAIPYIHDEQSRRGKRKKMSQDKRGAHPFKRGIATGVSE